MVGCGRQPLAWIIASQNGWDRILCTIGYCGGITKPGGLPRQGRKIWIPYRIYLAVFVHKRGYMKFVKYDHYYGSRSINLGINCDGVTTSEHNLGNRSIEQKQSWED